MQVGSNLLNGYICIIAVRYLQHIVLVPFS